MFSVVSFLFLPLGIKPAIYLGLHLFLTGYLAETEGEGVESYRGSYKRAAAAGLVPEYLLRPPTKNKEFMISVSLSLSLPRSLA